MGTRKVKAEDIAPQFPSLDGNEDVEVAKRSQDVEADATNVHSKVFVVLKREYYNTEEFHNNNIHAVREGLINQGLRPNEDGKFVGAEDHEDGESLNLTYSVSVTPAVVAEGEVSHAHVVHDSE